MPLRLAEYLRKSRAEENMDTEEVLARHHATLVEYIAARPELEITASYKEVKSGESLYARPEMLRLLEDVEAGKFDGVLCMDLDRLSRGRMTDQGIILDAMRWSNTLIYTPDKIYDLNNDMDDQMAEFKTFLSRQEWRLIRNRMQRGLQRSIAEGCYVANAPYGYRKVTIDRKPTLEIVEEEAAFVRQIYQLYQTGIGCTSIARTINAQGARPHRSAEFNRSTVAAIIRNPTYTGKIVWNQKKHIRKGAKGNAKHITIYQPRDQWLITDGLHPPIIDQATYDRCQEIMQERYIPPSNDGTIHSPLAGIVYCAKCGRHMQRMMQHKGVPYLLCNTTGCCAGAKFEYVEEAVLDHLRRELERLRLEKESTGAAVHGRLDIAVENARKELEAAGAAKTRLYEFLESGIYDPETFRTRMTVINDKIRGIQSRIAELEKEQANAKAADPTALANKIAHVLDAYGSADAAGRNALLRSVIDRIYYSKAKKTAQRDFTLDVILRPY